MTGYDTDFYAWANEQAALLRAGRLAEADLANIAEEMESLGKSERRELESRLTVLLLHLLKWCYEPDRRGKSWRYTIVEQRRRIADHLAENPSLNSQLDKTLTDAYGQALIDAFRETGIAAETFPETCPWSFEDIMADGFWPDLPGYCAQQHTD